MVISLFDRDSTAHWLNLPRKLGHRSAHGLLNLRVRNLALVCSGRRNDIQVLAGFNDACTGVIVGVVAVVNGILEH